MPASRESPSPRMWRGRSRNVYLTIAYNFADGACFSVWQATVLQVLLYNLSGGKNATVGWVSGVGGAAQVLAAIVCGYLADKHTPRHILCRAGAIMGFAAVAMSLAAVKLLNMPLFYGSSVLWGIYSGLANPSSEALFADSVPTGQRTGVYTVKWIVQVSCYTIGYATNLALFLALGNEWELSTLQLVMYVGLSAHCVALLILALLSDSDALPVLQPPSALSMKEASNKLNERAPLLPQDEKTHSESEEEEKEESEEDDDELRPCTLRPAYTPYFVSAGDLLMSLGSGMTLRYLPLFFIHAYHVNPALLMGLLIVVSVTTSVCASLAKRAADHTGRLPAVLAIRVVGTALLLFIALAHGTPAGVAGALLAAYVARNSLMNCTFGMSRSVIMDCVPRNRRARWSAFESFTNFSWAGSAALGGFIADAHGYCATFYATCAIHTAGALLLFPAIVAFSSVERRNIERIDARSRSGTRVGDGDGVGFMAHESLEGPPNLSLVISGKMFESQLSYPTANLSFADNGGM